MDHVVSPEDVEPIEVIVLDEETETCAFASCHTSLDDSKFECDNCHVEVCGDHVTQCFNCDDLLCPTCTVVYEGTGNKYCSSCHSSTTNCAVCGTTINSDWDSTQWCDSHNKYICDDHYAGDSLCYDCAASDGEDSESSSTGSMGQSTIAPWELRDVHAPHSAYLEDSSSFDCTDAVALWGVDADLSLNQGAADFYLLEVVQHNVDCGELAEPMLMVMAEEAKTYRKNLVEKYDPTFRGYVDMAIGGELRYHQAVGAGRHLPESRTKAWRYWKLLRERGGVELLLETADLFEEIKGGGVGGKPWADGARLLHARLTNAITPEQWVDRVFTLQHNGGAFTNKISWGPDKAETGMEIQTKIGPAHHRDPTDFNTLREYASPPARALFSEWWPVANKNRMRWGRSLWVHDNPVSAEQYQAAFHYFAAFVNQAWSTPSIINTRTQEWWANPSQAMARFRPFFVTRHLASNLHIGIKWGELDKYLARAVVRATLDTTTPKITAANMHRLLPGFTLMLCQRIVEAHEMRHAPAFAYLQQQGFIIPMEYHAAAGIDLSFDPF